MKNMDKKLLLPLLAIESESGDTDAMRDHITATLSTFSGVSWEVDDWGNIIARKGAGAFPVCVVAHMDTVHAITGHGIVPIEHGGRITGLDPVEMRQTGIGGDDKCGLYAALLMMRELESCRAVFTVDEEIGAIGARRLDLDVLEGVGFLIQADRRGSADMVTRACGDVLASPAFIKAAARIGKKYGYRKCEEGGLTDVQELVSRGGGGCCALNLSAGYHRPHSSSEYVDLGHLSNCVGFMLSLARSMGGRLWAHKLPPRPKYTPIKWSGPKAKGGEAARLDKYWADLEKGAWPTQAGREAMIARGKALDLQAAAAGALGMPDWEPGADRDEWSDEELNEWMDNGGPF